MDVTELGSLVVQLSVMLVLVAPFIIMGLRNQTRPDRWKLIGLSVLVFVLTTAATIVPSVLGFQNPAGFDWNWSGKFSCLAAIGLLIPFLSNEALHDSGLFRGPSSDSLFAVMTFLLLCALVGMLGTWNPGMPHTSETVAFQSLMPSLAEEPVFRGILPALLMAALGCPWKIAGAQLGWGWLAISTLFGLGHGLNWSFQEGLEFHAFPFVITGVVALWFGWLSARCGSIWPCVAGHSLINATPAAIGLASSCLLT